MSRIGRKIIPLPESVTVAVNGTEARFSGPKGELKLKLHPAVRLAVLPHQLTVGVENPANRKLSPIWGLFRSLVAGAVEGVTNGFSKKLEIFGTGFKATLDKKQVVFNLGFSHPVRFDIPAGIDIAIDKLSLTVSGIDKQLVGKVTAEIRNLKPVEPYKGKGIRYADEVVRRKSGKAAIKSESA